MPMPELIDLTGQKFGRLTVIARSDDKRKEVRWECRCACGNQTTVTSISLRKGTTRSCGCLRKETTARRRATHGKAKSRLYITWKGIKSRIHNKNERDYEYYGGRGIGVCPEWEDDFQAFHDWAIANGYADDLTIDRIDNNKNYSPDNCRWVDMKTQNNNKRSNKQITFRGKTQNLSQWAKELGIPRTALSNRIHVSGWSIERALTTPVKKK